MEAYLGMIMYFGGNFAPLSFSFCRGQIIPIAQNEALYSLLGTVYGGDGATTFALPNLSGRSPVGTGQAPGVSHNYQLGEAAGTEAVTLTQTQIPAHVHTAQFPFTLQACTGVGAGDESAAPIAGGCLGTALDSDGKSSPVIYAPAGSGTPVNLHGGVLSGNTGVAGGSQAFSILQPYLGLSAIICVEGIYPSRN